MKFCDKSMMDCLKGALFKSTFFCSWKVTRFLVYNIFKKHIEKSISFKLPWINKNQYCIIFSKLDFQHRMQAIAQGKSVFEAISKLWDLFFEFHGLKRYKNMRDVFLYARFNWAWAAFCDEMTIWFSI